MGYESSYEPSDSEGSDLGKTSIDLFSLAPFYCQTWGSDLPRVVVLVRTSTMEIYVEFEQQSFNRRSEKGKLDLVNTLLTESLQYPFHDLVFPVYIVSGSKKRGPCLVIHIKK
jgi:hypothetical protein